MLIAESLPAAGREWIYQQAGAGHGHDEHRREALHGGDTGSRSFFPIIRYFNNVFIYPLTMSINDHL